MIRFLCPACETKLKVPDDDGGELLHCPNCEMEVRAPMSDDTYAPRGTRFDEDEDRPRPRRRPKRRGVRRIRRERRTLEDVRILGFELPTLLLMGTALFGLFSVVLALLVPSLSFFAIIFAWFLVIAGNAWFIVRVFMDDAMAGLFCMFVPCYSLYYLSANFDHVKKPFLMQLLGWLMFGGLFLIGMAQGPKVRRADVPYPVAVAKVETISFARKIPV